MDQFATHSFIDASIQGPGSTRNFCYRSGKAVFEEALVGGILASVGNNAAGYPLNVLSNCPSRLNPVLFGEPSAFALELDGENCERGWKFKDFLKNEEISPKGDRILHCVLTLENERKPLRLSVHTLLDGTQMMTRYYEMENLSDGPMTLNRLGLLGGGLDSTDLNEVAFTARPDVRNTYSLGYFDSDDWGREGEFSWHDLTDHTGDKVVIDTRFGRNRHRHPLLFIRDKEMGQIRFMQIGWSGGCRFTVDYNVQNGWNRTFLSFCAEITGYHPLTVLMPGEKFVTPEIYFGVIYGGLDDAVNEMNAHLRRSVLHMPEIDGSACYVGAGMGAEHDMSVETTKSFMKQMADMGAEIFIIDAGWYCPPGKESSDWWGMNGINRPDAERYPGNSFAELRDYCHSLGMKFAMWAEIERIGPLAPIAAEHPEWFAGDLCGNRSSSGFIDLTVPEAAAWAENELARIIEEYKLDLLRVDYNISIFDAFRFRDLGSGCEECLSLRHYNAVYKLYNNLKKRFPDVIFENCAGGGGRTDLGIMRFFHHTWVSDNQKAPRSLEITNGMTMALPPERVDRLFAGMGCHSFASLGVHMRNTMLGHISLNVIAPATAAVNEESMAFVRHSVALYKDFIRPFLPTARIYHHTPERADVERLGYRALEIGAPDGSRGAMTVFAAAQSGDSAPVIRPRGIREDLFYRVTLDNSGASFEIPGYLLARDGIRITLPAPMTSELVLWEAKEAK